MLIYGKNVAVEKLKTQDKINKIYSTQNRWGVSFATWKNLKYKNKTIR